MAGGTLSPRQKMINLMYLVLTALLALNVSAEILKAFAQIDNSLQVGNSSTSTKTSDKMAAFKKLTDKDEKAKPNYEKAEQVRKICATLLADIRSVKDKLVAEGGNKNGKVDAEDYEIKDGLKRLKSEDNIDISSRIMVAEPGGKKSQFGLDFESKVKSARSSLSAFVKPEDLDKVTMAIEEPKNSGSKTWLQSTFGNMPMAGVMTLLTKFESDVYTTESSLINYLYGNIYEDDFKFDQLVAKVIPKSNYILTGQTYEAEVYLVAYDSKKSLPMSVGGSPIRVEDGKGIYTTTASSPGLKKYAGQISVVDPKTGQAKPYTFESEYLVAVPAAVISPTKMNVLYIGVENPIAISAPGIASENVLAGIEGGGGTLSNNGNGLYTAKVTTQGKANIGVNAKLDGKTVSMGSMEFRVKRIPDPIATVGAIEQNNIPLNRFQGQGGLIALLKDFEFEARFDVVSYRLIYQPRKEDPTVISGTGALFNEQMKTILRKAKPGDRFIIDEYKVRGPDGIVRQIPGCTYLMQ